MKQIILIMIISVIVISGCQTDIYYPDTVPPKPPTGLIAFAEDNRVYIEWRYNSEPDISGYKIWVSSSYNGRYHYVGSTVNNYFYDRNVINGNTYYYAVSAYDYDGNESGLSRAEAFATPRPEGYGTSLTDYRTRPNTAGYDFSTYSVGRYDDNYTDIFFEYYNGEYFMNVWDDTDIQDMGYTNSLYEITIAPVTGWSPTKDVKLFVGRTYVVWTHNDHYAKFRVVSLSPNRVVFDWSYQLQKGNRYLKKPVKEGPRKLMLGQGAENRNN